MSRGEGELLASCTAENTVAPSSISFKESAMMFARREPLRARCVTVARAV
jgi:hypothetical protein